MRLLKSEFRNFIVVLGVLWFFLESAIGIGVLPLSIDINPRVLYYILLLSISYNIASLSNILNKLNSDTTSSLPENQHDNIRQSLTDNDYQVLQHLERQRNELPSQTFSAVFPKKDKVTEFDSFTRRLVH